MNLTCIRNHSVKVPCNYSILFKVDVLTMLLADLLDLVTIGLAHRFVPTCNLEQKQT